MGNIESELINDQIEHNRPSNEGRFVINIVSATDIPSGEFMSTCDPYIKAYLYKETVSEEGALQSSRISDIVQTPKKINTTSPIWNSFRNFHMDPPADAFLMVELYDGNRDKEKDPIGSVSVGIDIFTDELPHNFLFNFNKVIKECN